MCGIVGYASLDGVPPDRERIERMTDAVKHRGPDGQGIFLNGPVGLGHARLSIIDLAGGQQPLFNEDRSVAVVCNGEIYNYQKLRDRLMRRGHQFSTHSDSEVLVHLWEDSGRRMTDELRGMFAFVVYDLKQGLLFGARDRFGQKPLFYHESPCGMAFASEIKSLLVLPEISRELDLTALDQYLFYSFVPSPRTLFAGIKKLPAGCWFELRISPEAALRDASASSSNKLMEIGRYWQPTFSPDKTLSDHEHLERVEAALKDAVASHLVADVPVGVMLSGGIDSSLIAALASQISRQPLNTFSISFPGSEHDEAPFSQAVSTALGTVHHKFCFESIDLPTALSSAAETFDQPLANTAILPLMMLSRATAKFVKVVLTGDGGDELFAGYRKYSRMAGIPGRFRWLTRAVTQLCPPHCLAACAPDPFGCRKLLAKLAQTVAPAWQSEYHRLGWEGWERHALYQPSVISSLAGRFDPYRQDAPTCLAPLNAALQVDQGAVLADRLLFKTDYATMRYGLEARAPLLDHSLAEVAGRLPLHLKATAKTTKVALRQLAERCLPAEIVNRRKKGFSMPIDHWFRHELRSYTREYLLEDSVTQAMFFQRAPVERMLHEHDRGKNHAGRIHTLLTLELWCRQYL